MAEQRFLELLPEYVPAEYREVAARTAYAVAADRGLPAPPTIKWFSPPTPAEEMAEGAFRHHKYVAVDAFRGWVADVLKRRTRYLEMVKQVMAVPQPAFKAANHEAIIDEISGLPYLKGRYEKWRNDEVWINVEQDLSGVAHSVAHEAAHYWQAQAGLPLDDDVAEDYARQVAAHVLAAY